MKGFLKSISENNTRFTLLLDKNLIECKLNLERCLFRIDKINFRSSITLNYTNLSRLISTDPICSRLREFIIDKKIPTFEKSLRKDYVLKNKSILKKLNQSQRAAVIQVIFAFAIAKRA